VPLFLGFPDDVPDDDTYFAERILGYVGNLLGAFDEGRKLENGLVVPEWLFDLERFGADPITQMQSPSLLDRAKAKLSRRKKDDHVEWVDLELVLEEEAEARLLEYLKRLLYAGSSIQEAVHDDLRALLAHFGTDAVEPAKIVMKETAALVLRVFWEANDLDAVRSLAKTPTDLLRLFAALTEGDVSLAQPIRFPKLRRPQRRAVLDVLERAPSLEEDLKRYAGLWRAVGRSLHVGEHARTHPKVAEAFARLRNERIETFGSRAEALLLERNGPQAIAHLSRRPGVFARRLHELLRRFPERTDDTLRALSSFMAEVPTKNLLVMRSYFEHINVRERRCVINKRGKIKVLPNNAKGALGPDQLRAVATLLNDALLDRLREKPSWRGQRVWIDPELSRYTVPLAQRAASDGMLNVGRGTRLPVRVDRVLRLFVYWKQHARRTDLDLSVLQFNDAFEYAGHVSYTKLAADGIAHSGDLQDAPDGAAEFIDITLSKIAEEVRYLAVQVHRYCGDAFGQMTAHAGWMVRDKVDASYATFDIKTVANKFDLGGSGGYCVPLFVDLRTGEIVITDLYVSGAAFHNTAEGACSDVALACMEVGEFTSTRPDLFSLAELHRAARGGAVAQERKEADITLGAAGCTHDLTDVPALLAEWL
jgi:stress response protein SCP2